MDIIDKTKGPDPKGCTNCIFHHLGMRELIQGSEQYKIIGECDHPEVPTKLTVSYGMLCNGQHHITNI